ncbi:MAG: hypothetical protein PVH04_13130, partial [Gammaproteobacteria bacterium]
MTSATRDLPATASAILLLTVLTACDKPPDSDTKTLGVPPTVESLCQQKTSQDLCVIPFGVAAPIRFEASQSNMEQLPDNSLQVRDQLILITPEFRWTLTEANVVFKPAANGGFDRITGEARVPFDKVPIMKKAKTGGGIMAALGYDQGKNLGELDAPLNADTHYLFFAFKENFGVSFGFDDLGIPVRGGEAASKPFTFSPVPSAKLVMALDAGDPFFYVSAKGLSPKKKKKDEKEKEKHKEDDDKGKDKKKKSSFNIGGFGYSFNGRIPESVTTPDFDKKMTGNLVLEGSVPFPPLPVIQYTGYYLVRQDATLQAISGDISVGFPLKLLTSFSVSLGNATAIAEVNGERAEILMAGQFKPDTSWVPAIIPLFPEEDVQLALRIDTGNQANNFLHGKGSYAIAGSAFAPKGLQFGKVLSKEGEFRITLEQIKMSGGMGSDLSPFKFGADTHFDAVVAVDKTGNHFDVDGNILIGALDTNGKLAITPAAVTLSAALNGSSDWQMALQGKLHKSSAQGMMFSGQFEVPPYLNNRIAKAVTQTVEQTKQDLNQKISDLTAQLNMLTADLPGVRKAAREAAKLALWNMDTDHDDAIVNQEIAKNCKSKPIPFCKSLARKAYNGSKEVKNAKTQLNALISQLNKKDDKSTRAALKAALQRVIDSNPVTVDLKVKKTTIAYLNRERKKQLHAAITHIDKLKSTGGQRINVKQELDDFTQSTLNQIARDIKKQANPVSVKSIGFDMPANHSGPIDLTIALALDGNSTVKTLTVSFDPEKPEQLPIQ